MVVLLFGIVWTLSAVELTFAASFLVAVLVASSVGGGLYLFNSSAVALGQGGNRFLELMQRSNDVRRGIRDDNTGLLNRWYLEPRLDEEGARFIRYGHSMAVVVLKAIAIDLARFSLDGWQAESAEAAGDAPRSSATST